MLVLQTRADTWRHAGSDVTCGVSRDGRRRETTRADATVASPLVSYYYPPAILGRCSSAATSPWCVVLRSVVLAVSFYYLDLHHMAV
jgi:hypothetical protein